MDSITVNIKKLIVDLELDIIVTWGEGVWNKRFGGENQWRGFLWVVDINSPETVLHHVASHHFSSSFFFLVEWRRQ